MAKTTIGGKQYENIPYKYFKSPPGYGGWTRPGYQGIAWTGRQTLGDIGLSGWKEIPEAEYTTAGMKLPRQQYVWADIGQGVEMTPIEKVTKYQEQQQGLAAGTLRPVTFPGGGVSYVPVGSPADIQLKKQPSVKQGTSKVEAGKTAIKSLATLGVSTDSSTVRKSWREWGLDKKYGTWVGSAVQWRAYENKAEGEAEVTKTQLEKVQQALAGLGEQGEGEAEEGEIRTINGKKKIMRPWGEWEEISPEEAAWQAAPTPAPWQLRGEDKPPEEPTAEDLKPWTTPEVKEYQSQKASTGVAPLPPTTLADIIDKISSGELKIPELEITKEAAELAKGVEKARAAQALASTQSALASRGMAFSGIRTKAEERLAAEHLANMSGISLKLADAIIDAARAEQSRMKPEYRSVGGNLYEIVPGQEPRMIVEGPPSAPTIMGTAETGYFQWDTNTGNWIPTGVQAAGRAPSTIGSAQTGYYQWDSAKNTWVPTGIQAADTVTPPITWDGKTLDIATIPGLETFRAVGGDRATGQAWLDINTDYTISTIDAMLDQVYGKGMPTSVAGQRQELAKDLMALNVDDVNAMAAATGMNPKQYIKEKIILPSGFDPDDSFWEAFLKEFSGGIGTWFKQQFGELGF